MGTTRITVTYGSYTKECRVLVTDEGSKASTTGNVYGIYDMSGGAFENVASYDKLGDNNLTDDGLKMTQETKANIENDDGEYEYISTKYVTAYSNGTRNFSGDQILYSVRKTGDSTKEVHIMNTSNAWFSYCTLSIV